ncbi:sensor histidine kinase [Altererythrobacter gangjinensis]|uniref:histidine kinase n=2 Tax=Pontixanthobacter gangjinensis TaxID=1028742 RepID=A0A6I4SNA6_9SPHN|nr:sensor histidine kinase [Pontixanthobacter gangjinensis]
MHFDDRLATVLRHRAAGERAARTQFRQLLDLLGNKPSNVARNKEESLMAAAWLRLGALGEGISATERAAMISDPSLRVRNAELVAHLAEDEPEVAAAALTKASLIDDDWEALIPRLPIRARGFLRLRRDLSHSTINILERLGIQDRGLPVPARQEDQSDSTLTVPKAAKIPQAANDQPDNLELTDIVEEDTAIGALVKRIEAFRMARALPPSPSADAPHLPLSELAAEVEKSPLSGFAFSTDMRGRIDWASDGVAPAVIGLNLGHSPDNPHVYEAIRFRQPLRGLPLVLEGAPIIEGDWIVDASPRFTQPGGRFFGYAGMIRRMPTNVKSLHGLRQSSEADRLRQLLHELRTPVNAIQGFSEVIQQQLFGPAPHEYRALAASIAGDSARMLAGFDELDRLARLETGALEIEPGETNFATIVIEQVGQLQEVLKPRTASYELGVAPVPAIPLTVVDAEAMAWRLLATITGAIGAGEHLQIELEDSDGNLQLSCEMPMSLAAKDDIFNSSSKPTSGSLSAGMFGSGFSLRLVRAEARAIGGDLRRVDDWLLLTIPPLTAAEAAPSQSHA